MTTETRSRQVIMHNRAQRAEMVIAAVESTSGPEFRFISEQSRDDRIQRAWMTVPEKEMIEAMQELGYELRRRES